MKFHYSRTILILLAIGAYSVVVFLVLASAQGGGSKAVAVLVAAVGIGGATIAILRYEQIKVSEVRCSSPEVLRTPLNALRIVALTVFVSVWSMQMYLSVYGSQPLRPLRVQSIRL